MDDHSQADVLAKFYATPCGLMAASLIARRLDSLWRSEAEATAERSSLPSASVQSAFLSKNVLGLGFSAPFARSLAHGAGRIVLGARNYGSARILAQSSAAAAHICVIPERRLPFEDNIFDRIFLIHALEEAEAPGPSLREIWRVLAPEGRLVIVAAHRTGIWAHFDHTPFGQGRSFTRAQLVRLLASAQFLPQIWAYALFAPPISHPFISMLAPFWESLGERLWPGLSGVLMVEAIKRLHAPIPPAQLVPARRAIRAGAS